MLHSFRGKLGQRKNLDQTKFVKFRDEFISILIDPSNTTKDILPIKDDIMAVNWKFNDESLHRHRKLMP